MTFISSISPDKAQGKIQSMYKRQQAAWGFVPNYARAFSHRPDVMDAWATLITTVKKDMDEETYLYATLAAAQEMKSSYCSLAYGKILREKYSDRELQVIVEDIENSVASDEIKTVIRVAKKTVRDSSSINANDIAELRSHGFDDSQIFDIIATAAARCFFAKLVDGLGTKADSPFMEMNSDLRILLTVGRAISDAPVSHCP